MDYEFKNKELEKLYISGRSRKYKLQPQIIKKFFMRISQLEAANNIYDLWQKPSVNFEKLPGFENRYSLRLDRKWRLEIEIEWENKEQTRGKVYIVEVSCHYGD